MTPEPFDPFETEDSGEYDIRATSQPPMYTMEDAEVETTEFDYPDRTKNTYIISGPLGKFHPARRGTRYKNAYLAELDVITRFGARYVRMIRDGEALGIWAAEVKKP